MDEFFNQNYLLRKFSLQCTAFKNETHGYFYSNPYKYTVHTYVSMSVDMHVYVQIHI